MARWQLLRAGLTGPVVDSLIEAERLVPLHRGVYGVGHRPDGPSSRERAGRASRRP